jgi:hypothetical protein
MCQYKFLVTRTVQSILNCTPWACSQPFQLTLEDSTELCVLVLVRHLVPLGFKTIH